MPMASPGALFFIEGQFCDFNFVERGLAPSHRDIYDPGCSTARRSTALWERGQGVCLKSPFSKIFLVL